MAGGEVLVVSGEPLWPSNHGGRIRTARLAAEMGRRLPVRVIAPIEGEPDVDLPVDPLPPASHAGPTRSRAAVGLQPRLGHLLLDGRRRAVLGSLIEVRRPAAVLFAQSYLAAMASGWGPAEVVDFTDVEVRRAASLARHGGGRARLAHSLESLKARRWEPPVARRAALCLTPSPTDAVLLEQWGARALFVPHGADPTAARPSPPDGPVTYVASFSYAPNLLAARFLIHTVWPRLRRTDPGLRLRLVGRQADRYVGTEAERAGVDVVSDPPSTEPYHREASVVVAPAQAGGGAQVKVVEALARGRVVVATPFSALSAPEEARGAVAVAEGGRQFAAAVGRLWRDVGERRRREAALGDGAAVPTWEEACAPLVDALVGVMSRT